MLVLHGDSDGDACQSCCWWVVDVVVLGYREWYCWLGWLVLVVMLVVVLVVVGGGSA